MKSLLLTIWHDEHGQDLIEFAVLAAMLAVGVTVVMPGIAEKIRAIYETVQTQITRADS